MYVGSLFSPPLLDDVDAAHAEAAQHFAESGDWITLKIDGIRYIEKPPLPYWVVGVFYKIFGESTFSTHLPNALAMLGLCWLSWAWARRAWGDRAGLYAGLAVLTSIGPFLFTRFVIPESYLALFLIWALYGLITGLELGKPIRIYWCYIGVALAVLTKGLIAPVFFIGATVPYLLLTGQWRRWRELKLQSPGRFFFSPSPRRGTFSAVWPTPIRAIRLAITPPSAMFTASFTSTSSTNMCCGSSRCATPTTTTSCPSRHIGCFILCGSFRGVSSFRRF